MRFMVLWQSPHWPEFQVDLASLQPALAGARYAQGRAMGMASHLQLMDLGALQLQGWADEAMATAQIEGETLQVNSVRASAARRLGLADAKAAERDAQQDVHRTRQDFKIRLRGAHCLNKPSGLESSSKAIST